MMKTEDQEITRQQTLQQELHLDAGRDEAARAEKHPLDEMLREDRLPHIWCSGCGLGIALNCFSRALLESGLDLDKVCVVSGIGCTGRVAGYVKLDSFHTTHGRAIPFATGLKLANPELKVVVFSGDGDLVTIGGNHFIHAARRNVDMTVICVNNFNYGMTGGQVGATTPLNAITTTTPYGNFEYPLNISSLAAASGAVYVARWTVLQARQLEWSMLEALQKPGFSLVEVIAPCPTSFGRQHKQRLGLDTMRYYRQEAIVGHHADVHKTSIELGGEIVVGKFVDVDKPTYLQLQSEKLRSCREDSIAVGEGHA
jgi:2-oxoglutarate ferredoxin oxidoreductase subunit beta